MKNSYQVKEIIVNIIFIDVGNDILNRIAFAKELITIDEVVFHETKKRKNLCQLCI